MGVFSKYSNNYDNGKKLMEEGEFNQAIYEFDKCIDSHGHDSYILQLKAYCLMQLEEYNAINENGFVNVSQSPLSTFAADVDTGSYCNLRRIIRDRELPLNW